MKAHESFPSPHKPSKAYRLRDRGWRLLLQRRVGVGLLALGFALGFAVARWL